MSDLGTLSHCMMDGDREATGRARRLRRKALVASLFLESLLIAAMLVLLLITPGVLPKNYIIIPLPPFPGVASANPVRPHSAPHSAQGGFHFPLHHDFSAPHQNHLNRFGPDAPEIPNPGSGAPDGPIVLGPGIPGVDGNRIVVAPPAPKPPRKVSIGVMEASLIYRVDPVYPPIARAAHISGEVRLRATIGTDGAVKDYEVVNGNPLLVRAAITAIRQWRYRPTRLNGEPVEVETIITVNFILQQK